MTPGVDAIAFAVLAGLVLSGAVMMLASRNVVHAAFWMLLSMVSTGGLFLLLSAEFLALVQILVYAGAVAVLTLFTIMITLRRRSDAVRTRDFSASALAVATGFAVLMYLVLSRLEVPVAAEYPASAPDTAAFGAELFTTWAVPFEIASLVLLVALIGAVWWSRGKGEDR
jgi:NADH-quinone oxidoreductase subunit J